MSSASYSAPRPPWREQLAYNGRVLRVIAATEFKLKYADSVLGYVWSLAKPLSYFGVLWVVFGRFFKTGVENFPLYLLLGIVLYTFLVDAVGLTLPSIVARGSILRRLSFPPLVIPLSVSLTAFITFCVNTLAVVVFIAVSGLVPQLDWLLIPLLLAELYVFVLGLGLIIATLFVRFRDVAQLWELTSQLLLFASPVVYPVSILPDWAQRIALMNPFVQVMQDIRYVMLGPVGPGETIADVFGSPAWRLAPIAIAIAVFSFALLLFRREAPRFAELV
jgi:ABC-2 type transport system permease protein